MEIRGDIHKVLVLILALGFLGCAQNVFTGSEAPPSQSTDEANGALASTGNSTANSSAGLVDGFYYALKYSTFCNDSGPIAIIRISGGASQAIMTRQSCQDLSVPIPVDISILKVSDSVILFEDLVYIPHVN